MTYLGLYILDSNGRFGVNVSIPCEGKCRMSYGKHLHKQQQAPPQATASTSTCNIKQPHKQHQAHSQVTSSTFTSNIKHIHKLHQAPHKLHQAPHCYIASAVLFGYRDDKLFAIAGCSGFETNREGEMKKDCLPRETVLFVR